MKSVSKMLDWIGDQLVSPGSIDTFAYSQICEMAHAIEAEVGREYLRFPLDADGAPIRVGDKVEYPSGKVDVVRFITINGSGPMINERGWLPDKCRRYHKPTIEDVLRELADDVRLEYIEHSRLSDEALAAYADKLREAMADE